MPPTVRVRSPLVLASALLAAACAPRTTVTPISGGPRGAALPIDSVAVYRQASQVPRPYTQVAIVSARADFTTVSEAGILRALRKEAGRLGANGLLVGDVSSPTGARKVGGLLVGGELALRQGQAVAILVSRDTVARGASGGH